MGKFIIVLKILGIGFVGLILVIFLGQLIFDKIYQFPPQITYGVTFSPRYARYLNLDWQNTYLDILDNLKVKNLRVPLYWDKIQKEEGEFDFGETDFIVNEADKRRVNLMLVLGYKQPRWPECYIPAWAKSLSVAKRQQKILEFIRKTVERYNSNKTVSSWQVENEPLLPLFGEGCDPVDKNFLKGEVNLVRSLSQKQIIVTESGEFGFFVTAMKLSDKLGISVYRKTFDPILGYKIYPLLPYMYNLKSSLVQKLSAPDNQKTIITELQAEPWLKDGVLSQRASQQAEFFPVNDLKDYINYAKDTGFDEMYLWGIEWWYFMKEHGYPQYLEYAKTLFLDK